MSLRHLRIGIPTRKHRTKRSHRSSRTTKKTMKSHSPAWFRHSILKKAMKMKRKSMHFSQEKQRINNKTLSLKRNRRRMSALIKIYKRNRQERKQFSSLRRIIFQSKLLRPGNLFKNLATKVKFRRLSMVLQKSPLLKKQLWFQRTTNQSQSTGFKRQPYRSQSQQQRITSRSENRLHRSRRRIKKAKIGSNSLQSKNKWLRRLNPMKRSVTLTVSRKPRQRTVQQTCQKRISLKMKITKSMKSNSLKKTRILINIPKPIRVTK